MQQIVRPVEARVVDEDEDRKLLNDLPELRASSAVARPGRRVPAHAGHWRVHVHAHVLEEEVEEPATRDAIGALNAEMGISVLFGYILRRSILDLFTRECINIHPALLPYNRGAYPNVWSIVDGTPAGVTLHYIDEHVDTGDIIAQREVLVDAADTGGTLYGKLERAAEALFCETWPLVRSGKAPRIPQGSGGTYHRVRDAELIDEIDLDRPYKAGDLINILRARSFPPHRGAYFRDGNRKVYIELSLISEQDAESRRLRREQECPQN